MAAHPTGASGGSGTGSNNHNNSSSSWRNPSPAVMKKYNLRPLPDDFEPTEEEEMLLDTYETIRNLERQAARLKESAARAKLDARQAEFQSKLAAASSSNNNANNPTEKASGIATSGSSSGKKIKRKRREKVLDAPLGADDDHDELLSDDDDELKDDNEDDELEDELSDVEEEDLAARREAKLAALREEVAEAKQRTGSQNMGNQEDLRAQHLVGSTDITADSAIGIRKKQRTEEEFETEPISLIANLKATKTPPHDFSEKLGLSTKGIVLFPTMPQTQPFWTPPPQNAVVNPNEEAFLVDMDDFDINKAQHGLGNNTVAVRFKVPAESRRFSINIAAPDHNEFDNILFHFNPRQRERGGQVVINSKEEGIWGQAVNIPLSQVPLIFGQTSLTLLVQITGDGFDVFLQDQHVARLEHRQELNSSFNHLVLQFPSTDDSGKAESWKVFKVWWGHMPLRASNDTSHIPGVKFFNSLHPRKLFISKLPKITVTADVELRRAELERAFRKYGGAHGVQVFVPTNSTFSFVEMETPEQADLALKEMSSQYRLHRARQSRYEVLQEERAAKAAAGGGNGGATTWDK